METRSRFSEAVLMTPNVRDEDDVRPPPARTLSRPTLSRDSLGTPEPSHYDGYDARDLAVASSIVALQKATRLNTNLIIAVFGLCAFVTAGVVVIVLWYRKIKAEVNGMHSDVAAIMNKDSEASPSEAVETLAESPEFISKISVAVYDHVNKARARRQLEQQKLQHQQLEAQRKAQLAAAKAKESQPRPSPNPKASSERSDSEESDDSEGEEEEEEEVLETEVVTYQNDEGKTFTMKTRNDGTIIVEGSGVSEEEIQQIATAVKILDAQAPEVAEGMNIAMKKLDDGTIVIEGSGIPTESMDAIARAVQSMDVSALNPIHATDKCSRSGSCSRVVEVVEEEAEAEPEENAEASSHEEEERTTPSETSEEPLETPSLPEPKPEEDASSERSKSPTHEPVAPPKATPKKVSKKAAKKGKKK